VKVGIVGCGGIAHAHADAYKDQGCRVVGVTDSNSEAAKSLAESTGASVFADYKELLDKSECDIVSICTPPIAHGEAAVYALRRGVNVLCEKPMAYDAETARAIADAAKSSSALFMPAFRHRFLPANIALREMVNSGEFGDLVLFNNIFCGPAFDMEDKWFTKKAVAGGGSILDTNSHSIDLFRFIAGEVTDQKAVMHQHFKTTDVEDAGILIVKSERNAIGSLQSAFVAGTGVAVIDIMCTKGRIVYDYDKGNEIRFQKTGDVDWSVRTVQESWGFVEEIRHFIGAVNGEHELACTVEDGVRAMEIICSVY
jgi:predicted dehydrogenase